VDVTDHKPGVTHRKADEYSLRWSNGDWIVAHVSEATGVFSICSSWGAWSHRWNVQHLGKPTLASFLSDGPRDYGYFARKLIPPHRQTTIDVATSRREMKRGLCELRRDRRVSSEEARDCWYEIEEWEGGEPPCASGAYHLSVHRVWTPEWTHLVECVLPHLLESIGRGAQ
jgi:hypothetical protein